jgi:hypothetical protein
MQNGKAVAVSFPLEKTGWKNKNSYANTKRSEEMAELNKKIKSLGFKGEE